MMTTDKTVFIIRGLPGAGKSELGMAVADVTVSEDDFFHLSGEYAFEPSQRYQAIGWMVDRAIFEMETGTRKIALATCALHIGELAGVRIAARANGYRVFTMLLQNTHGGKSIHNVQPEHYAWMAANMDCTLDYSNPHPANTL